MIFSKLYTDETADLGRKMDVGNMKLDAAIDVLRDIKTDTSVLSSFVGEQREHNQWMKEHQIKMDDHNQWMKDHLVKMDEHNGWMKEHNLRLEKILEKLAEK
jgi:hypothetical protein